MRPECVDGKSTAKLFALGNTRMLIEVREQVGTKERKDWEPNKNYRTAGCTYLSQIWNHGSGCTSRETIGIGRAVIIAMPHTTAMIHLACLLRGKRERKQIKSNRKVFSQSNFQSKWNFTPRMTRAINASTITVIVMRVIFEDFAWKISPVGHQLTQNYTLAMQPSPAFARRNIK